MSTETLTIIIACASLVVMVVTFFITFRMYVYMKKSDLLKSKNEEKRRRKDIMAHNALFHYKSNKNEVKVNKYFGFSLENEYICSKDE